MSNNCSHCWPYKLLSDKILEPFMSDVLHGAASICIRSITLFPIWAFGLDRVNISETCLCNSELLFSSALLVTIVTIVIALVKFPYLKDCRLLLKLFSNRKWRSTYFCLYSTGQPRSTTSEERNYRAKVVIRHLVHTQRDFMIAWLPCPSTSSF